MRPLVAVSTVFALYAAFMWCAAVDMAAELHSPTPGGWVTYDIENVPFYSLDAGLCGAFAIVPLALRSWRDARGLVAAVLGGMLLFRLGSIYWLYFHTHAEQIAPFIYKKAFEVSGSIRNLFLPAQVALLGWACWHFSRSGNPDVGPSPHPDDD